MSGPAERLASKYLLSSEEAAPLAQFYEGYLRLKQEGTRTLEGGTPQERVMAIEANAMRSAARRALGGKLGTLSMNGYAVDFRKLHGSPDECERHILGNAMIQYKREGPAAAETLLKTIYERATETVKSLPPQLQLSFEQQESMNYDLSEIVGNQELIVSLERYHHRLLNYNVETGSNPFHRGKRKIPRAVLVVGPPGTGKTTILRGMIQRAKATSKRHGLAPVYEHLIDNSDKTEYQNSGLRGLNEKLALIKETPGVHLTVIDDADLVVYSRGSRQSEDEGRFLNQIMAFLEQPGKGNEQVYVSMNHMRFEEALFGRTAHKLIRALGPVTAAEKGLALEQKLAGLDEDGLLAVPDWQAIGDSLKRHDLSGRDIRNIASMLVERSEARAPYDLDKFDYTDEEVAEAARQGGRIGTADIHGMIEHYVSFKGIEARKRREELIREGIDRRVLETIVEREAQRELGSSEAFKTVS